MWRLLLFISALPIAIALAVRWWFGIRVLQEIGNRACTCDLGRWFPSPSDSSIIHRADQSASEFGQDLRLKALADWQSNDPKAATARENSKRFGMAVPPLSGVVAVFATIVAKIPLIGGISLLLAATALASALGLLSLPPELQAISQYARKLRSNASFPNRDDEEAVIRCAIAHAWKNSLPPILNLVQR